MSHSTHCGFRLPNSPLLNIAPGSVSRSSCDGGNVPFFPSCPAGVGHIFTACASFKPRFGSSGSPCPGWDAFGVGHNTPPRLWTSCESDVCCPGFSFTRPGCVPVVTVIVGQNPNPVSLVSGIDGTSWNNKRLCGVTVARQVSQHCVEPHRDVPKHIFTNDPSGPDSFDNIEHCRPEVAVIVRASALPGMAEGLARVAASKDGSSSKPGKRFSLSHVAKVWDAGTFEFLREDFAGIGFDLTEFDRAKTGVLRRNGKASNTGEQV